MKLNKYQSHFGLKIGNVDVAYCYIRKNGCSSWKTVFVERSPHPYDKKEFPNPIGFMVRYHKVDTTEALAKFPTRVVVLRDPVFRVISGFLNQYVLRLDRKMDNLHGLVAAECDRPAEEVNFNIFVQSYLRNATHSTLNEHFWAQAWHLAPIPYTDIWPIEQMHARATRLLGTELADGYFKVKQNATSGYQTYEDQDASALPAAVLFERFKREGRIPDKKSFLQSGDADVIRAIYKEDEALYRKNCQPRELERS